jgi:hypothetical protein
LTHNPCRYGECCTPRLFARTEETMRNRRREFLDLIKDAALEGRTVLRSELGWENLDTAERLISDGLIIETVDGLRPHP